MIDLAGIDHAEVDAYAFVAPCVVFGLYSSATDLLDQLVGVGVAKFDGVACCRTELRCVRPVGASLDSLAHEIDVFRGDRVFLFGRHGVVIVVWE